MAGSLIPPDRRPAGLSCRLRLWCKTCPHCQAGREDGAIETSLHWLSCEAYSELRAGLDPELNLDHRVV